MANMNRRSVLAGSVSLAAASVLARPYVANAQAKTANIWVGQGFVPQEDAALKKTIDNYEKELRQQDRLQHHAVYGAEPEDDLRPDQRGCPGPCFLTTHRRLSCRERLA